MMQKEDSFIMCKQNSSVKPALVVMAAGMGSRFGGPKQITPVDENGHIIMDFSLYDAKQAGCERVVFVIKHSMEEDFKEKIGRRMEKYFDVRYVYQELDRLPEGFSVPEGRVKPWGTGHAIACAAEAVDGPFAVINADDYYGADAIHTIFEFLHAEHAPNEHAMVGYRVRNTVTEHGHVARGVCLEKDGMLQSVTERTHIEKRGNDAAYTEDGEIFHPLSGDTIVSMNLWGFQHSIFDELNKRFPAFLEKGLAENPLKCEFYLPTVADAQIQEGLGTVRVLPTEETWYGVTYREDLQTVVDAVKRMKETGRYPASLWED